MNYKKLIDRKIFVLCTDTRETLKVYNFLRYKNFDLGEGSFYRGKTFKPFEGMGIYLTSCSKYGVLHTSNRGILQDNNSFTPITDVEFNRHNKIPWWVRKSSIFGYISIIPDTDANVLYE